MKILPKVEIPSDHPYLSNKYTLWYYSIVMLARQRCNNVGYTEKHHIIPDCFFVKNRSKVNSVGWISSDSNNPSNLVHLTLKEHITCHWLLTKMTVGIAYRLVEHAFASMSRSPSTYHVRHLTPVEYARVKEARRLARDGMIWYNDGKKSKLYMHGTAPATWQEGCLFNKNKSWYNNGEVSAKYHKGSQPDGWVEGCLYNQTSWYNNGEVSAKYHKGSKPDGWVAGRIRSGKKYYTNGVETKLYTLDSQPDGWVIGHCSNTGKTYYNNGVESKLYDAGTEPDGWAIGKIIERDMRWYNNGITDSKFEYGKQPTGWFSGRLFGKDYVYYNDGINERAFPKGSQPKGWSEGRLNISCPYCGKTGAVAPLRRWHFENCKMRICDTID